MAKKVIDKRDKKRVYNMFHFYMRTCENIESSYLGYNSPMATFRVNEKFGCEEKKWVFLEANDYSPKTIIFLFDKAKRMMANENKKLDYNSKTDVLKYNGKPIETFEEANNYLNERFISEEKTIEEVREFNDNYENNMQKIANLGVDNIIVKAVLPKGMPKKENVKVNKSKKLDYAGVLDQSEQNTDEGTLVLAK